MTLTTTITNWAQPYHGQHKPAWRKYGSKTPGTILLEGQTRITASHPCNRGTTTHKSIYRPLARRLGPVIMSVRPNLGFPLLPCLPSISRRSRDG